VSPAVDWGSALAFLAVGLVVGGLVVWRVFAAGRPASAPVGGALAPLERRDLEAKRDALVTQLRELEDTAAKRQPDQLARERYALELEAARVLLELDAHEASRPPSAAPVAAGAGTRPAAAVDADAGGADEPAAATGILATRPALRGFLWGTGSIVAIGLLLFAVSRSATERGAGGSVTGTAGPMAASGGTAAPTADEAAARAAVERNPDDVEARLALVRAHLQRDDMMAVWSETQEILKRVPGEPRALSYQALVRLAMGQPEIAHDMLQQALQAAPDLLEAYINLALVQTRMGDLTAAQATIDEATRRHPDRAALLADLFQQMQQLPVEPPADAAAAGAPAEENPHAGLGAAAPGAAAAPVAAPPAPVEVGDPAQSVAGVLELDPSLAASVAPGAIVFLLVRHEGVTEGPPVAVERLPASGFPLRFTIGPGQSMMGEELPETLRLEARLDSDGDAMSRDPADPVAVAEAVRRGSRDVRLVFQRKP
jgi:cytochrome c-type biogenesis protein CcmH